VVLLGPTHEASHAFLAGADLDWNEVRSNLPRLAWTSITAIGVTHER
jgi:hypothetical protein